MKKLYSLLALVGLFSTSAVAQTVTMNNYDHITHIDGAQIMSGDTIEIQQNESWEHYVNLHFAGVAMGDVNFRVKEIVTNSCSSDQICAFLDPDPEFQANCWPVNNANYTTPLMTDINFANGDEIQVKPLGNFSCGAMVHMRYFIRLDGVELDSFDIKVTSMLSAPSLEPEPLGMTAYPNPANNSLTIATTGTDGNCVVRITDVLGKVVYSDEIGVSKKLDVSDFKNGVYLVTVSEKGQPVQTRRIVIKH